MDNYTKIQAILESTFPEVKEECIDRIAKLILEVTQEKTEIAPDPDAVPNVTLLPWVSVPSFGAIPKPCQGCPNHPSNGGSGVCHCTLGIGAITY